jgi:polar amino acid transport system substrate-binding protein
VGRQTKLTRYALIPAAALALSMAACAEDADDPENGDVDAEAIELITEGQLTTCTELPYEPFQFTEGGETVGFDVDLIDLVAEEIGAEQEIVDTSFEGIESGESLNIGQCDVAAAAMTITEERQQVMDFSEPYFDADQALLVQEGSGIEGLEDLEGGTLGVHQGTTGENYAEEHKHEHGYDIRQYEDVALLQTAVQTGAVDAAISDNSVQLPFAEANPDTEVTAEFPTGESYGFAVQQGNEALLTTINDVLAQAKEDGRYDEIYEKWFGAKPNNDEG